MVAVQRRFLVLALLTMLAIFVAIQTGWTADDRVLYALLVMIVVTQLAWIAYIVRKARSERFIAELRGLFGDE